MWGNKTYKPYSGKRYSMLMDVIDIASVYGGVGNKEIRFAGAHEHNDGTVWITFEPDTLATYEKAIKDLEMRVSSDTWETLNAHIYKFGLGDNKGGMKVDRVLKIK